jgi:hypothetical protein
MYLLPNTPGRVPTVEDIVVWDISELDVWRPMSLRGMDNVPLQACVIPQPGWF